MDKILAAYRKSSKQWSATFNKLGQVVENLICFRFCCWKLDGVCSSYQAGEFTMVKLSLWFFLNL
ncbi:hypothetical protein Hdeb2414_s0012g00395351 [Helianthus debilis subsp. tardiflorus]